MDSDNWIVQNLNSALSTWDTKLTEIWGLLTQSPEDFKGGAIWTVMLNVNDGLKAIGYGLLVLFFAAGIVRTCSSYTDIKKPEHAVKAFIRFALAQGAVMHGMELLTAVFSIVQGMVSNILSHSGMTQGVTELPAEIVEKIESVGMLESIPLWIVTLLGSLLITVLSFVMILTVICIRQSRRSLFLRLPGSRPSPWGRTSSGRTPGYVWKGQSLRWPASSFPYLRQARPPSGTRTCRQLRLYGIMWGS